MITLFILSMLALLVWNIVVPDKEVPDPFAKSKDSK
jgi:hypothetical protein